MKRLKTQCSGCRKGGQGELPTVPLCVCGSSWMQISRPHAPSAGSCLASHLQGALSFSHRVSSASGAPVNGRAVSSPPVHSVSAFILDSSGIYTATLLWGL